MIVTSRRLTARGAEPGVVLDIAIPAVVFGIIGARVYHVLTHYNDYFGPGKDPMTAFYVWQGGIAIFGSLLGGALGVYIGCRFTGHPVLELRGCPRARADPRPGHGPVRQLLQPRALRPADQPAVGTSDRVDQRRLSDRASRRAPCSSPTFLYEIIWNVLVLVVLLLLERRYHFRWGKLIGLYFVFYGIGRVWFESIRIDPSVVYLGLRTNVWAALIAIVLGIVIFRTQSRRHPGLEPSVYRPGKEWVPTAPEVDSEETYSDSDDDNDAAEKPERSLKSGAATSGASV